MNDKVQSERGLIMGGGGEDSRGRCIMGTTAGITEREHPVSGGCSQPYRTQRYQGTGYSRDGTLCNRNSRLQDPEGSARGEDH
ncbi:hypothetical protein GDO81_029063 [Engystomops pustulosus]|uniref:Uncharacterized protein n=1 Tax=Engystomops pustulosus TaxID=76066 RepID=A0AAV6YCJ7_ENGPU|nr:hypothetical protein GDO81_029063 [Engystomops pustulosus]